MIAGAPVYVRGMARRPTQLDPKIVAWTRALLTARVADGVARQEVSGPHGLDAETARQYLREAGGEGHGGSGARWRLRKDLRP